MYRIDFVVAMASIYNSKIEYLYLVFSYFRIWLHDIIDYYYAFLILSLPAYMFGAPIIKILESDYSDSESEETDDGYDVFVKQFILVFRNGDEYYHRELNGCQLVPLLDKKNRWFVSDINQYYDNLDTIVLKYIKFKSDTYDIEYDTDDENNDYSEAITKIIDVERKYDIKNMKSCKMGIVF